MRHTIVGIDAGKTSALAFLGLDGKVVKLSTGRFVGLRWFVETIREVGSPVVIAGDKTRPDALIKKLSAIFDAVLFTPLNDISVERKRNIAGGNARNLHERDALAAATVAYNAYAPKLRHAERLARENSAEAERVMAMVIKRYSVDEAIRERDAGRRLVRRIRG